MKILVLIDKFKGTITSGQLGKITKYILETKGHSVDYFSISDGGDGYLSSIKQNLNCKVKYAYVYDALHEKKKVSYLMDNDKVYIEVAKIIGFRKDKKLDIYNASTYGVGQIILDAIKKGGKEFYIGLGGSISNDGGKGMLTALGYNFDKGITYNEKVNLSEYKFNIVCDVVNPLLGKNGATYVFSKQKGAKNKDLIVLENKMVEYHNLVKSYLNKDFSSYKSSGAAGGLGYAFISFLNACCYKGIDFVINHLNIKSIINDYDLIITGEGKIDQQSLNGKVAFELSSLFNKKFIYVCAINKLKNSKHKIYSIVNKKVTAQQSLKYPVKYYKKLVNSIELT